MRISIQVLILKLYTKINIIQLINTKHAIKIPNEYNKFFLCNIFSFYINLSLILILNT